VCSLVRIKVCNQVVFLHLLLGTPDSAKDVALPLACVSTSISTYGSLWCRCMRAACPHTCQCIVYRSALPILRSPPS